MVGSLRNGVFANNHLTRMPSMCKLLTLSPAVQKQILRQARDRGFDAEATLRLRAVLAVAAGLTRRAVATVLFCAASTVVRAVERFSLDGFEALQDRRHQNGQRKVSRDYLERLHCVLDLRADEFGWQRPTWTRESLALTMAEQDFPLVAPRAGAVTVRPGRARSAAPPGRAGCRGAAHYTTLLPVPLRLLSGISSCEPLPAGTFHGAVRAPRTAFQFIPRGSHVGEMASAE